MSTSITISFSDEVLRALRKGAPIRLALVSPGGAPRGGRAAPARRGRKAGARKGVGPREGSLPARLAEFAKAATKPFTTAHVSKAFRLSRAHASLLLSRAVSSGSLKRQGRGVYAPR